MIDPWDCPAAPPGGCFFALVAPCADAVECAAGLAEERRRVFRLIHERAAAAGSGEEAETWRFLAAEFTSAEQLLSGEESSP